ncbi:MAG: MFS transporter [Acidimicrobiales bacterium]|jgi:MFS family permease
MSEVGKSLEQNSLIESAVPTNALAVPPFRSLWLNSVTFYLVVNALRFVYGWVVLDGLNKSESVQGLVVFVLGIPLLFLLLPAGVWADRLDPKKMLITTQVALLVVMAVTAIVMGDGAGSLSLILVSALFAGIVTSLGTPVRSSLIPALLKGDLLYSGIALNAIALTLSLVLGAVTARAFGDWFGFDGAFWWLVALTGIGTLALLPMKSPGVAATGDKMTLREAVRVGLTFVWREPGIRSLFLLLAVSGLMMTPIMFVTLQAHIKEELGRSAGDAAPMLGLMGVGIALSSVFIMRRGNLEQKSVKFMRAMLGGTICMFLMGRTTDYWQVMVLALTMGICGGFFINMNQGLIQSNTPPQMMGRVMGLYALVSAGLTPFGALALGLMSEAIGTGNAISLVSAMAFSIVLAMYLRGKAIREIR